MRCCCQLPTCVAERDRGERPVLISETTLVQKAVHGRPVHAYGSCPQSCEGHLAHNVPRGEMSRLFAAGCNRWQRKKKGLPGAAFQLGPSGSTCSCVKGCTWVPYRAGGAPDTLCELCGRAPRELIGRALKERDGGRPPNPSARRRPAVSAARCVYSIDVEHWLRSANKWKWHAPSSASSPSPEVIAPPPAAMPRYPSAQRPTNTNGASGGNERPVTYAHERAALGLCGLASASAASPLLCLQAVGVAPDASTRGTGQQTARM